MVAVPVGPVLDTADADSHGTFALETGRSAAPEGVRAANAMIAASHPSLEFLLCGSARGAALRRCPRPRAGPFRGHASFFFSPSPQLRPISSFRRTTR